MMMNLLYKLLLLHGVMKMSEGKPLNEHIKYVNIGETVVLECYRSHLKIEKAVWRKGEFTLFQESYLNPDVVETYKYSIVGNHKEGQYFLKIHNITEEDLQSYFCETETEKGLVEKQIRLSLSQRTTYFYTTIVESDFTSAFEIQTTDKFAKGIIVGGLYLTTSFQFDHTTEPDISLTTGISGTHEEETFLSGLKMYEKFVLFGMAGAGFVLLLALCITWNICISRKYKADIIRARTEPIEQSNQTDLQSTIQTSSYDYIDVNNLLSNTDLFQSIVSRVSNRDSRAVNSIASSERSYVERVDHIIDVQLHTYQSMIKINNAEAVHHYVEINNSKAPSFVFWSSECGRIHHRNSLGDLKNIYGGIETSCKKRANCNSWPQEFRTKCKESVVKKTFSVSQIPQDSINPEKR